jgi:hypothetical protein
MAAFIDRQESKPTKIVLAKSQAVAQVTAQPVEQPGVALTSLPYINGTPTFVIENIDSNLLTEIYNATTATSLQDSSIVSATPEY